MIRVKLTVRNPRNLKLKAEETFLVDTGACYPSIRRVLAEKLKIKSFITTDFILADGTKIIEPMAYIYLTFAEERVLVMVALTEDTEGLLSLDLLAALGIHIDTSEEKLLRALKKRLPESMCTIKGSM